MANGAQIDNNVRTKHDTANNPPEGLGSEPVNPGQGTRITKVITTIPVTMFLPAMHGSTSNFHRSSSQVSLNSLSGHSDKWKHVTHNRPKADDALRGTATSNKVSGTSDPHGYLFISRVSRDTRDEDMLE